MKEVWTQWKPIEGIAGKHYEKVILFDIDVLKIIFKHELEEIYIQAIFDLVRAYRYTNESYVMGTIYDLDERYGGNFYINWTFFKVENSSYIQWLQDESQLPDVLLDKPQLCHFAFIAYNSIIDVIAAGDPKISIIERSMVKTKIEF